ncbi:MAG: triose-phosphate isomerase [Candidatus Bathyarchaeia archaeon]
MGKGYGKPVIIVNFKTYLEGLGDKALMLAKQAEKISERTGVYIGVAPQPVDLRLLASNSSTPVFSQHVDGVMPGAYTGCIVADALADAGAAGSLINHSERRLKLSEIDEAIRRLDELRLISVVCSNTPTVSAAAAALNPDMVAVEPPELIGTGIAVSKAKPEIVSDTVEVIKRVNPRVTILCGAGITRGEDVEAAIKLGSEGVLVASGVVKAGDPGKALSELAEHAQSAMR